jgi:hypothetical protein
VITFAPLIACKYFSLELATILHAVAAWSDVAGVAVAVLEIREENFRAAPGAGSHVAVTLQTGTCLARDRRGLAKYLRHALRPGYAIETRDQCVCVEWFPPGYTPH